MFELGMPWALLLLPLPLVLIRGIPARSGASHALIVPRRIGATLLAEGASAADGPRHVWRQPGMWAVWVLMVFAVSDPRSVAPVSALPVSGRDLALVIDLSGSMVRDDFHLDGKPVTRLEAVKTVGAAFARGRGGDRMALVVFGSEAYFATPFTYDVAAVAQAVEGATIGISGRATNMSDGLGLALKRMTESTAETRVIILLSDGVNNAGATNPRQVAALAAGMGVRIHTIALGPKDLQSADEGERGVVDAATLRAISELSGGESFRVRTTDDLMRVSDALDALEPTDGDGLAAEIYRVYWPWAVGAALCLTAALVWRRLQ